MRGRARARHGIEQRKHKGHAGKPRSERVYEGMVGEGKGEHFSFDGDAEREGEEGGRGIKQVI